MSNIKVLTRKKLFGTAIFVLFALGVALSASSIVQALFVNEENSIIVSGVINSIEPDKVIIFAGDSSVVISISQSTTVFKPLGTSFGDLSAGDFIKVTAKTRLGNTALARIIEFVGNGPGYGTQGDSVLVTNAIVTDIDETLNTFTVNTGGLMTVTFEVSLDTVFEDYYNENIIYDFADINKGSIIYVNGTDSETGFVADFVRIKSL